MARRIPERLSKAAKKRHVESGGDGECPFCGADYVDLNYGDFEPMEGGRLEQQAWCDACGRRWVDIYRLIAVLGVGPDTGARH